MDGQEADGKLLYVLVRIIYGISGTADLIRLCGEWIGPTLN